MQAPLESTPTVLRIRPIVERPRLTRLLDRNKSRIKILIAPAGYGKSTLAEQWMVHRPHAWYPCTAASSDVAGLAHDLSALVIEAMPHLERELRMHLRVAAQSHDLANHFTEVMVEHLVQWPDDRLLVIDDYQLIAASADSEALFEAIVERTTVPLLITARTRPAWASARQLLYGDIYELEQKALAITRAEAAKLLAGKAPAVTRELTTISRGWPAILSLGWHADPRILPKRTGPLPEHIDRFITQEVYEPTPLATKHLAACLLGLTTWDARLFTSAFGETDGERWLDDLISHGFTSPVGDRSRDAVELHPLIRTYLINQPYRRQVNEDVLASLTLRLIADQRWDEAWSTAELSVSDNLRSKVMLSSFDALLRSGRSATLAKWLKGESNLGTSPVSLLVRSEISLRRGDLADAESFAIHALHSAQADDWTRSRAHLVAGKSSHLSHRNDQALSHFRAARSSATSVDLVDEAEWGEFLANSVISSEDGHQHLENLSKTADRTDLGRIRFATATYFIGRSNGDLSQSLELSRITYPLTRLVNDPLNVTSFLHAYSTSLALSASYDDSLRVSDEAIMFARRFRIDFSLSHLLVTRAISLAGIGSYEAAKDSLHEALRSAKDDRASAFVETNVAATAARIALMNGEPDVALSATKPRWSDDLDNSMIAEMEATRSLALFIIGSPEEAQRLCEVAVRRSRTVEATSLAIALQACNATLEGDGGVSPEALFVKCRQIRAEDAFVVACRAFPMLSERLRESAVTAGSFNDLLRRSHDIEIATPPYRRTDNNSMSLTRREIELANLLIVGLSNRQLAEQLYLSETTVKVHLRHIFKKLNVKNRTEAVVKLLQMKQRGG